MALSRNWLDNTVGDFILMHTAVECICGDVHSPPHVEYLLTEKGRDLLPVFYAAMMWGFKYEDD